MCFKTVRFISLFAALAYVACWVNNRTHTFALSPFQKYFFHIFSRSKVLRLPPLKLSHRKTVQILKEWKLFVGDRIKPLQLHDWIRGRLLASPMTSFRPLERTLWNAGLHAGSVERRRATFCPSFDLSRMRLSFGIRSCINLKLGIRNPSTCFSNCPTRLNGNPWKPWLRHCMGIAWHNNHRRMILLACWRICFVVLSGHPGLRYWWRNRPLQCRVETRAGTVENQKIRWWGRFGCWTRTCCSCRVNANRFVVLQSRDVPAEWRKKLFTMIRKTMRAKGLSSYCFHPYFLQNCCFHVTSSHGPDSRQPRAGRTTRISTALQGGRTLIIAAKVVIDNLLGINKQIWIVSLDLSKVFDRNNWVALWLSPPWPWHLTAFGLGSAMPISGPRGTGCRQFGYSRY